MFLKNHSQVPLQGFIAIKRMFRPLKGLNGLIGTDWVSHHLVGGHHGAYLLKNAWVGSCTTESKVGIIGRKAPWLVGMEGRIGFCWLNLGKAKYWVSSTWEVVCWEDLGCHTEMGLGLRVGLILELLATTGFGFRFKFWPTFVRPTSWTLDHWTPYLPSNPHSSLKETSNTKPSLILLDTVPFITDKILALIWAFSFPEFLSLELWCWLPKTKFFWILKIWNYLLSFIIFVTSTTFALLSLSHCQQQSIRITFRR